MHTSSDSQALPSIWKKSDWSSITVVRRALFRSACARGWRVMHNRIENGG